MFFETDEIELYRKLKDVGIMPFYTKIRHDGLVTWEYWCDDEFEKVLKEIK